MGSIGPSAHVHFTVSTLCLPSRAIGKQALLFLMLVVISFFVPPANVIQSLFVSSNIATLQTSHQEKGEPVQEAMFNGRHVYNVLNVC